jgi:hypothetical protein
MPDTNTPPKTTIPDPAKSNADVANKLIDQSDLVNAPLDLTASTDALDKLAEQVTKEKEVAATAPVEPKAGAAPIPPTPPAETPEQKTVREAKEASDKESTERLEAANKLFKDAPALPANASPKSSEAFNAIKIKAAQEISQRDSELEKIRKELEEAREKLKNPVPPELENELKDHRAWRAKMDVDSDPKFKEFDKEVSAAHEFIYAQLKKSPVITEQVIAEIKKLGGPENVNMAKIFDAAKDPTLQRLVESKIADIEMTKFKKDQAIQSAKTNIDQYMTERQKQMQAAATQHTVVTKQRVENLAANLDWLKEKPVDPKAEEAVRGEVEDHNKFVKETRDQLSAALQDDSAEMRAILLVGMAQLFNYQRLYAASNKQVEALKTQLSDAQKNLGEVTGKWEKVKNASTSRLRESAAPSGGVPKIKASTDTNVRAGDALDAIAKQVMEERAAKAT